MKILLVILIFINRTLEQCPNINEWYCFVRNSKIEITCDHLITNFDFTRLQINSTQAQLDFRITFENQNFTILPNYIFKGLKFEMVVMAGNKIETISNYTFSDINKIQNLVLRENKIRSIENLITSLSINSQRPNQISLESITKLDLSYNFIGIIELKFSRTFRKLTELKLNTI